jgi:hypothetical protein
MGDVKFDADRTRMRLDVATIAIFEEPRVLKIFEGW